MELYDCKSKGMKKQRSEEKGKFLNSVGKQKHYFPS